jgi:hypothetical protein
MMIRQFVPGPVQQWRNLVLGQPWCVDVGEVDPRAEEERIKAGDADPTLERQRFSVRLKQGFPLDAAFRQRRQPERIVEPVQHQARLRLFETLLFEQAEDRTDANTW